MDEDREPNATSLRPRVHAAFALLLVSLAGLIASVFWAETARRLALTVMLVAAGGLMVLAARIRPRTDRDRTLAAAWGAARLWLIGLGIVGVVAAALLHGPLLAGRVRVHPPIATATANLRAIGTGMAVYWDDYDRYPPSLQALVADGEVTARQLVMWDDGIENEATAVQAGYSSFVYLPGKDTWPNDAHIVLAYQRRAGLVRYRNGKPETLHAVLFGDLHAEALTAEELAQALLRDRERRTELGWPLDCPCDPNERTAP